MSGNSHQRPLSVNKDFGGRSRNYWCSNIQRPSPILANTGEKPHSGCLPGRAVAQLAPCCALVWHRMQSELAGDDKSLLPPRQPNKQEFVCRLFFYLISQKTLSLRGTYSPLPCHVSGHAVVPRKSMVGTTHRSESILSSIFKKWCCSTVQRLIRPYRNSMTEWLQADMDLCNFITTDLLHLQRQSGGGKAKAW